MKQYSQNIAKGKEIMELFIKELESEGIVHVPIWECPNVSDVMIRELSINDSHNSNELLLGASASSLTNGKTLSPVKKGNKLLIVYDQLY